MREGKAAAVAVFHWLLKSLCLLAWMASAQAQSGTPAAAPAELAVQVVDVSGRPGTTQRFLYLSPPHPQASLILFSGGNGGLRITPAGDFLGGKGNFLVRTRQLFAERGFAVVVVDAPSDRQTPPFLGGFRQTPQHVQDIAAVMSWLRQQAAVPVWLVGTSRGTQSAAYIATALIQQQNAPDGLVLTSTILRENRGGTAVPDLPLRQLRMPVLVVHHEQDGCMLCAFGEISRLMNALGEVPQKQLIAVKGGISQGDPCEAWAYHGYNGIEADVVGQIADWVGAHAGRAP